MSIIRKVKAVEKIFDSLEQEIKSLQSTSGLHCIAGCGKCCIKPEIEATPLEFIPFAYHLYLNGHIEAHYDVLLTRKSAICSIFVPVPNSTVKGRCSEYQYRGLICRLFGYSAIRDKHNVASFITCAPLKDLEGDKVAKIRSDMNSGQSVPMMNDYYFKIRSIDPDLGTVLMPINQAILRAMEHVMGYYAYRKPPPASRKLSD